MLGADQNAMTEVALALAMAFFAIFVLAAVSMSQPVVQAHTPVLKKEVEAQNTTQFEDIAVSSNEGGRALESSEEFFALYQGRFFDKTLTEVALSDVQSASTAGNVVLAVSPSLPMQQVLHIKQEKNLPNLSISILNEDWISRLEAL